MTDAEVIRVAMGLIGSIKTPAKAAAARKNGLKGGRPKKNAQDQRRDTKRTAGGSAVTRTSKMRQNRS